MAPVSSLLVYYVTEGGEPVSDVVSFHVRLLHKEVIIDFVALSQDAFSITPAEESIQI